MNSYTGTSKSGTVFRYYKCSHPEVCTNKQTVKKDVLETAITKAFEQMLSIESNFNLLTDKILETYNSKLYDTSSLRFAEKELNRVENSLTNLIAAVENGFFSDTTNARLKELEQRKVELKALIAVEKEKEVQPLTREQVTKYLSYAITQPSQTLIDLLVRKAIVKGDTVDIYLKYATDDPPVGSAHAVKYTKNPERNLSERGFFLDLHLLLHDRSVRSSLQNVSAETVRNKILRSARFYIATIYCGQSPFFSHFITT